MVSTVNKRCQYVSCFQTPHYKFYFSHACHRQLSTAVSHPHLSLLLVHLSFCLHISLAPAHYSHAHLPQPTNALPAWAMIPTILKHQRQQILVAKYINKLLFSLFLYLLIWIGGFSGGGGGD